MKVSIVIPAYNEESNIAKTISCALSQNYSDFEVIVVDNNSKDNTSSIAKSMGVKVILEKRQGVQWARECGRREASGLIIANLDADCLPDIDWLSNGVRYFDNKNVVLVTGPYDYYESTKFFRFFSLFFQRNIYSFFNYILQKLNKGAVAIGGNILIRKEVLDSIGGYNTDIVFYGDDTDTAKRMSKKGIVVFDRKLIVKTSNRRLKSEGSIKISVVYIYHFFRIIFKR